MRDASLSTNVTHTVMGAVVGIMERSRVHTGGNLPVIHTAWDEGFTGIEHGGTHEATALQVISKKLNIHITQTRELKVKAVKLIICVWKVIIG